MCLSSCSGDREVDTETDENAEVLKEKENKFERNEQQKWKGM